jgi:hypothetical protein
MPGSKPDYLGWFNSMSRGAPRRSDYVGLPRSDAIELAHQEARSGGVGILDLDELQSGGPRQMWTADGRPDRLNMVIKEGIVVAAAMF